MATSKRRETGGGRGVDSANAGAVPADLTESGVWKRSKDPDEIWGRAYRVYAADVRRWIDRRVKSPFEAEQMHGAVFDKLRDILHETKEGATIDAQALLHKITDNKILNHWQHLQHVPPPDGAIDVDTLPSSERSPESRLDAARREGAVQSVLEGLLPGDAEVLLEADGEERTLQEIADQRGVSVNTIASRVRRAREKFARKLTARAPWWAVAVTLAIAAALGLWRWLRASSTEPVLEAAPAAPPAAPSVAATAAPAPLGPMDKVLEPPVEAPPPRVVTTSTAAPKPTPGPRPPSPGPSREKRPAPPPSGVGF